MYNIIMRVALVHDQLREFGGAERVLVALKNIFPELGVRLKDGVISKINQSDERNIILRVFAKGRVEPLIISTHPRFSRIHLTAHEPLNTSDALRL